MHHASTFDGIHTTDGYHLAWQWILAAVSSLVGVLSANPSMHLAAMICIVQNVYPRGDMLLDTGGLRVPMDAVDVVIPPPANFPELTAFGLYRLKRPVD
jgi:hypothetical protein